MAGEYYVATFRKVGNFRVALYQNGSGRGKPSHLRKQGGNVVTYFCTPDGEVLHLLVGPTPPERIAEAARWAVDAHARVRREGGSEFARRAAVLSRLHREAARKRVGGEAPDVLFAAEAEVVDEERFAAAHRLLYAEEVLRVVRSVDEQASSTVQSWTPHLLLAQLPYVELELLQEPVFELLAGQQFAPRTLRQDALLRAVRENVRLARPTLLVVSPGTGGAAAAESVSRNRHVVAELAGGSPVGVTNDELTTLIDDLGQPPVQLAYGWRAQYVILDAEGARAKVLAARGMPVSLATLTRFLRRVRLGTLATPARLPEEKAVEELRLAPLLIDSRPDAARTRLQRIVDRFPETTAATEAATLLAEGR